ncbi:MAG: Uma2 family endonuclease [Roseiflexaceae bacterium]|nr:Uma2 family endonuclease [Roseiflexaceae bacterium]
MAAQPKPFISEEAYLVQERDSLVKHEYYNGEIFAMSGGTEAHSLIAGNAHAALHSQLRRRDCRVYQSDMRIKVQQTGLNTYPDVTIVCGQPQFTDEARDTILNPVLIIEVLSPSTERYDRGMKFQNYRTIDTLQDYIIIAQDHHHIEHYSRQETGQWLLNEVVGSEATLDIPTLQCHLTLEDVYEKVEFVPEQPRITRDIAAT